MRRSVCASVAILGLMCASTLPATLRPPAPRPPVAQAIPTPAMVEVAVEVAADVAGPAEYARMLRHCLAFEWKQAESVARRYVDLVDGRDRTDYVAGLLYRMRAQHVTSLRDLTGGSVECARGAGVSLHNLMLFFRQQGTPGWRLLGESTRLMYDRGLDLAPGDLALTIVRAGLMVDLGDAAAAERLFPSPPLDDSGLEPNDVINMAYYHAARGNRVELMVWLARATKRAPEQTREWAADSDDLDAYRDDALVMNMLRP